MKRVFTIAAKVLLGLVCLVAVIIIGLLIYYRIIYKETALPPEVKVVPEMKSASMVSEKPVLLPVPKKLEWTKGYFNLPANPSINAPREDAQTIKNIVDNRGRAMGVINITGIFNFVKNKKLGPQAYYLSVQPNSIKVVYGDFQGVFYALTTLKQLALQSNNKLPCVEIEDKPDLSTRGVMLDISRGKVPSLETLFAMVDFLSDLKYNHLELYIEGFSFAYPSFRKLWEKTETPLTPEEIRQLDRYCKEHFIELVPNQNSLGHMNAWLATEDYKALAECPKGYRFLGLITMKSTLSPNNPGSLELVKKMSDDLLPNFSSGKFNVDLDEPFELGKNKDHPISDPKEVCRIYLDYAKRLNTYVESKGKKMLMWGDVISRNPEFASEIPKDITLLEWRYESFQSFENICKKYRDAGLHYMVCPGTSSWTSFTGRTDNMLANVENAVQSGIKYGADGMLITDWGDSPHLQYLTASYPGLAYGAALSWNDTLESKDQLGSFLSKIVFNDASNKMGDIVLELGRYSQYEEYPMVAGTMTAWSYRFGIMDKTMTDAFYKKFQNSIIDLLTADEDGKKTLMNWFAHPKIYNPKAIVNFTDSLEKELLQTKLNNPGSKLIIDEYRNSIRMIKLGAKLKQFNNYHLQQTEEENKLLLTEMKSICSAILSEHEGLWMSRNKRGGYEQSIESFKKLQSQIEENLTLINKNTVARWFYRVKEKIITAVAVLYLK
jgi:hexosaminidase